MTTYDRLKHHLRNHEYIRGKFKGDAPADASRRAMNHFRVIDGNGCMVVSMHKTNIIVAYPDGRVKFNTDGWHDAPTTRACVAESMKFISFPCSGIINRKVKGISQPVIYVGNSPGLGYLYYDDIMFDGEGKPLTELRAFEQRHIDKAESKEFMDGMKASGFKDAFALLYATAESDPARMPRVINRPDWVRDQLTDVDDAPHWSDIIAAYKFSMLYNINTYNYEMLEMGTAKSCWALMMTALKADMYVTTRSDVYCIPRV